MCDIVPLLLGTPFPGVLAAANGSAITVDLLLVVEVVAVVYLVLFGFAGTR